MPQMESKPAGQMPDHGGDKKLRARATFLGAIAGMAAAVLAAIIFLPLWALAAWLFSQGDNPAPLLSPAGSEWGSFLLFLGPPIAVFCSVWFAAGTLARKKYLAHLERGAHQANRPPALARDIVLAAFTLLIVWGLIVGRGPILRFFFGAP